MNWHRTLGMLAFGGGLGAMDPPWWAFLLLVSGLVFYVRGVLDQ